MNPPIVWTFYLFTEKPKLCKLSFRKQEARIHQETTEFQEQSKQNRRDIFLNFTRLLASKHNAVQQNFLPYPIQ